MAPRRLGRRRARDGGRTGRDSRRPRGLRCRTPSVRCRSPGGPRSSTPAAYRRATVGPGSGQIAALVAISEAGGTLSDHGPLVSDTPDRLCRAELRVEGPTATWTARFASPIHDEPAGLLWDTEGLLVVKYGFEVYALDARTGELRWHHASRTPVVATLGSSRLSHVIAQTEIETVALDATGAVGLAGGAQRRGGRGGPGRRSARAHQLCRPAPDARPGDGTSARPIRCVWTSGGCAPVPSPEGRGQVPLTRPHARPYRRERSEGAGSGTTRGDRHRRLRPAEVPSGHLIRSRPRGVPLDAARRDVAWDEGPGP